MPALEKLNFVNADLFDIDPFGRLFDEVPNHDDPFGILEPQITKPSEQIGQFRLVEAKKGGATSGGLYKDMDDHTWLLKESQWGKLENGINEYIAGGVYQHLLGPYAPQIELIYDSNKAEILVGSKYLDDFQTLHDFSIDWNHPTYLKKSYQGKPIQNFNKVLASIILMKDTDAHTGNVGVRNMGSSWQVSKIDHGFAFQGFEKATMACMRKQMKWYYNGSLDDIGFENLYQAVTFVANVNYDEIEQIVNQRVERAQAFVDQYEADNVDAIDCDQQTVLKFTSNKVDEKKCVQHVNLQTMKADILKSLKDQIAAFKAIELSMNLERAINKDDVEAVKTLRRQGKDVTKSLQLFNNKSSDSKAPYKLAKQKNATRVADFYEQAFGFKETPPPVVHMPARPRVPAFNAARQDNPRANRRLHPAFA